MKTATRPRKKVTARFPKPLKVAMQEAIIKSGYGLHGKSRWLQEAIIDFLGVPNFIELVEHGISINQAQLTLVEAFYLDIETITKIRQALVAIRTHFPLLEGVQSALLRAAIVYRLMLKK